MRYVSTLDIILNRCAGKRVLHLGCIGFADCTPAERISLAKQTLHWKLTQISDVLGVDYSSSVVELYRSLKIFDNVIVGDATELEALSLAKNFDVVVAGDILEHVSDPGRMLSGIHSVCNSDSELILTTPNSFGLLNFVRYAAGHFRDGAEHVMCFNTQQLSTILIRHGFRVLEMHACYQAHARLSRSALAFTLGKLFFQLMPKFGGTLLAVARATDLQPQ